jgi:hypothetical protein
VWGEFVDLTNGAGNDTIGVRWQLGEDVTGLGTLRNMQNPPIFGDPDRMLSNNYVCSAPDQGGLHSNSGVNNKAAYLMTDGGVFNGYTVTGLGIAKVADLYYEVQTNMLTSGSNYLDLYNALTQAAINLGYSASDRQEIQDALQAVQMNQRPCADPPAATLCSAGQPPAFLFFDDLENITSGNWTSTAISGTNQWFYPQTTNPYGFDATYASSGIYNMWGYNAPVTGDYFIRMNSGITLAANTFLHFKHDWNFEAAYDGGVVEYSTNGGSTWNDAGPLFTDNGYNGTINTSFGNPLGGRSAFTGESHGYTASRLNLSSLAGQNVRFRFRIGTDSNIDDFGWFLDDIHIYTCSDSVLPPPSNLTATPALQTLINLAWTDNSNTESGFKIERSPNGTSDWTQIATVGANITAYPNTGLTCNTPYWYRVRAFNTNSDSLYSNLANAATLPCGSLDWQILFDETHGYGVDYTGNYTIEDNLSDLAVLLSNAGATVNSLTPPSTFNNAAISQYDVLVLVVPQSNYAVQEQNIIKTFVQSGGRLVVIGEWGGWPPADTTRPILNAILSNMGTGIALNDNLVEDPTNNDASVSFWPIIHQFLPIPINQGVSQTVEYAGASLTVNNPGYATAWADEDSFIILNFVSTVGQNVTSASAYPIDSSKGQFDESRVQIAQSGALIPMMAMANVGSGDVFVISDMNLWTNNNSDGDGITDLYEYNNSTLALNVFLGQSGAPHNTFLPIILHNAQ